MPKKPHTTPHSKSSNLQNTPLSKTPSFRVLLTIKTQFKDSENSNSTITTPTKRKPSMSKARTPEHRPNLRNSSQKSQKSTERLTRSAVKSPKNPIKPNTRSLSSSVSLSPNKARKTDTAQKSQRFFPATNSQKKQKSAISRTSPKAPNSTRKQQSSAKKQESPKRGTILPKFVSPKSKNSSSLTITSKHYASMKNDEVAVTSPANKNKDAVKKEYSTSPRSKKGNKKRYGQRSPSKSVRSKKGEEEEDEEDEEIDKYDDEDYEDNEEENNDDDEFELSPSSSPETTRSQRRKSTTQSPTRQSKRVSAVKKEKNQDKKTNLKSSKRKAPTAQNLEKPKVDEEEKVVTQKEKNDDKSKLEIKSQKKKKEKMQKMDNNLPKFPEKDEDIELLIVEAVNAIKTNDLEKKIVKYFDKKFSDVDRKSVKSIIRHIEFDAKLTTNDPNRVKIEDGEAKQEEPQGSTNLQFDNKNRLSEITKSKNDAVEEEKAKMEEEQTIPKIEEVEDESSNRNKIKKVPVEHEDDQKDDLLKKTKESRKNKNELFDRVVNDQLDTSILVPKKDLESSIVPNSEVDYKRLVNHMDNKAQEEHNEEYKNINSQKISPQEKSKEEDKMDVEENMTKSHSNLNEEKNDVDKEDIGIDKSIVKKRRGRPPSKKGAAKKGEKSESVEKSPKKENRKFSRDSQDATSKGMELDITESQKIKDEASLEKTNDAKEQNEKDKPLPKKRGRKPKPKPEVQEKPAETPQTDDTKDINEEEETERKPKKRGRKPKKVKEEELSHLIKPKESISKDGTEQVNHFNNSKQEKTPKKRGRKPKARTEEALSERNPDLSSPLTENKEDNHLGSVTMNHSMFASIGKDAKLEVNKEGTSNKPIEVIESSNEKAFSKLRKAKESPLDSFLDLQDSSKKIGKPRKNKPIEIIDVDENNLSKRDSRGNEIMVEENKFDNKKTQDKDYDQRKERQNEHRPSLMETLEAQLSKDDAKSTVVKTFSGTIKEGGTLEKKRRSLLTESEKMKDKLRENLVKFFEEERGRLSKEGKNKQNGGEKLAIWDRALNLKKHEAEGEKESLHKKLFDKNNENKELFKPEKESLAKGSILSKNVIEIEEVDEVNDKVHQESNMKKSYDYSTPLNKSIFKQPESVNETEHKGLSAILIHSDNKFTPNQIYEIQSGNPENDKLSLESPGRTLKGADSVIASVIESARKDVNKSDDKLRLGHHVIVAPTPTILNKLDVFGSDDNDNDNDNDNENYDEDKDKDHIEIYEPKPIKKRRIREEDEPETGHKEDENQRMMVEDIFPVGEMQDSDLSISKFLN